LGIGSKDFGRGVALHGHYAQLPGIVELIELGADFEPMFTGFYRASLGWDGKLPVLPFA
jgi:hypothetical protein